MNDYIMETRDLTKDFGDFRAVDKLNLKIKRGEVFGFLGPNGAGKTTSIRMMVGLLRPTSGQVLVNGQDVHEVEKGTIGVCPQEMVLWEHLTPAESLNLMGNMYGIPKKNRHERAEQLLADLFLTDKAKSQVKDLSGGMKRRLNLALAIVHQPEIVVLDEPSEGLDPQSRRVLWNYIRSLRDDEGKTVILTTHLMDEADKLSDRIAIIDHSKLLRLDTPENLKKEIGEGDVVDMKLSDPQQNGTVLKALEGLDEIDSVLEVDGRLNVHALDAVGKLPQIMGTVESSGVRILYLSVRQNTLEDVFIDLTGTRLRD
ncbi:MAG: ATP-binding cassette domain-containing protein [Methanobacteriaceae archaeon]|nr:ATP-binding cassette domain-containing protein [Methanobacteriaceae archaeon]